MPVRCHPAVMTVPHEQAPPKQEEGNRHMSDAGGIAADQLRAFIERIERLAEEKKVIADDIKEVYAEAKGNGFDAKILRKVISMRKKQPHEREEEEAILDLYMQALGMAGGGDE
jgi:uncharacterized protein (UPF0335 family)